MGQGIWLLLCMRGMFCGLSSYPFWKIYFLWWSLVSIDSFCRCQCRTITTEGISHKGNHHQHRKPDASHVPTPLPPKAQATPPASFPDSPRWFLLSSDHHLVENWSSYTCIIVIVLMKAWGFYHRCWQTAQRSNLAHCFCMSHELRIDFTNEYL